MKRVVKFWVMAACLELQEPLSTNHKAQNPHSPIHEFPLSAATVFCGFPNQSCSICPIRH